jgi:hypothetical protein
MYYSKSEEEYNTLYCHLTSQAPHQIIYYFNKNWHNIREQWVFSQTTTQTLLITDLKALMENLSQSFLHFLI